MHIDRNASCIGRQQDLKRLLDSEAWIESLERYALAAIKYPRRCRRSRSTLPTMSIALPAHRVHLPRFGVGRFPVTVAQWRVFYSDVQASRWQLRFPDGGPSDQLDPRSVVGCLTTPVRFVSWFDAHEYCRWLDNRIQGNSLCRFRSLLHSRRWRVSIPSEAEWEIAARGLDGDRYPWGDDPGDDRAGATRISIESEALQDPRLGAYLDSVGTFPGGTARSTVENMIGGLFEWTRSRPFRYPYRRDEMGMRRESPFGGWRILRGSAFHYRVGEAQCWTRGEADPRARLVDIGFRIALSPDLGWRRCYPHFERPKRAGSSRGRST